jgi:hypothetical protein
MEFDITKHRLYAPGMDMTLALGENRKILWRGQTYVITQCGISNDLAFAETEPRNDDLEFELATHIADSPKRFLDLSNLKLS